MNRARNASRARGPVRSAAFSRPTARPGSRRVCGTKNGRSSTRTKPAAEELGHDVVHPVLARVEVEHELALREPRHPCEERATVARVVDRPEDRGRRDRPGGLVEVQVVALCDRGRVAEPTPRGLDHRRLCVDSGVAQSTLEEERPEPAVAAGEVEHLVARVERDAERRDQLGAVREVGPRVRVLGIRPIGGLARVLVGLAPGRAHSRASVSGCSRTKRAMLRACQTV